MIDQAMAVHMPAGSKNEEVRSQIVGEWAIEKALQCA